MNCSAARRRQRAMLTDMSTEELLRFVALDVSAVE